MLVCGVESVANEDSSKFNSRNWGEQRPTSDTWLGWCDLNCLSQASIYKNLHNIASKLFLVMLLEIKWKWQNVKLLLKYILLIYLNTECSCAVLLQARRTPKPLSGKPIRELRIMLLYGIGSHYFLPSFLPSFFLRFFCSWPHISLVTPILPNAIAYIIKQSPPRRCKFRGPFATLPD